MLVFVVIITKSGSKLCEQWIPFDAYNSENDKKTSAFLKLEIIKSSYKNVAPLFHQVRRITNFVKILRETDRYTLTHKRNSERSIKTKIHMCIFYNDAFNLRLCISLWTHEAVK